MVFLAPRPSSNFVFSLYLTWEPVHRLKQEGASVEKLSVDSCLDFSGTNISTSRTYMLVLKTYNF